MTQGKGKGLDKEHTATNPETGEMTTFTQRQWKDKQFRDDLKARGFERPEDAEEFEGDEGDDTPVEGEGDQQ
jgi:hypothetical protein